MPLGAQCPIGLQPGLLILLESVLYPIVLKASAALWKCLLAQPQPLGICDSWGRAGQGVAQKSPYAICA